MGKILVTGAAGQIGSDLVPELRQLYGNDNVVAAGHVTPLPEDIRASGPCITLDVRSYEDVERVIKEHGITVVYHLSSLLSVLAEANRPLAYAVNFTGNFNILEASLSNGVKRVNLPSSIAVFGADAPSLDTPNDVSLNPTSLYGVSKVYGENMGTYYRHLGLDVRGTRLPGIISWKTEPTAGTTDYAVAIFYGAISEGRYTCYLRPDTALPMMYMPDAIRSLILLDQADPSRLIHSANFNLTAMSFTPAQIASEIEARIPGFQIDYEIDPLRQAIADSWPDSIDDSPARDEWDWKPEYDLPTMVDEMLANLRPKLASPSP